MHSETISIPHKGTVLGVQSIDERSYLLLAHGSIHILTCIVQHPTWHIKLPFYVHTFVCSEQGIYLGGVQYNNAQRTHAAPMIIALSHNGKLRWSYKGNVSKREVWAIHSTHTGSVTALIVEKTHSDHTFYFLHFNDRGTLLWEKTCPYVVLQSNYCNPQKIPPRFFSNHKGLFCVGAFSFPQAQSAIAIIGFDLKTGDITHRYIAPKKGGIYTQHALSSQGHLAIAWQPIGIRSPSSGILLFDETMTCVGEYRSYLHCWMGMIWYKKSLILSGKSRATIPNPALESIGKEKFFHEFKAHRLIGQTHQYQKLLFYLHQSTPNHRQLIMRNVFETQILDEGELLGNPFHSTHNNCSFHSIAYNNGDKSILLRVRQ